MFIVVGNKKLWIEVTNGEPTVSFEYHGQERVLINKGEPTVSSEFHGQERVLINKGENWNLQAFYDKLVQFSECSTLELVHRSRAV